MSPTVRSAAFRGLPRLFSVSLVFVGLVALLVGCPESKSPTPSHPDEVAPATSSQAASVGSGTPATNGGAELVPLDAVDSFELPEELAKLIATARARVPARPSPAEQGKLDDLESRYERIEAAALGEEDGEDGGNPMRQGTTIAHVLAGYYWDRLRLFTPELPVEVPEELVTAFERGH